MKKLLMTVIIAVAVLALAPAAKADTITTVAGNCSGGCPQATYTLTVHDNGGGSFHITLNVAIAGSAIIANFPTANDITAVAFKIVTSVSTATLTSFPGGTGPWTTSANNLIDAGCTQPGAGWVCSSAESTVGQVVVAGGSYTWQWDITSSGNPTAIDSIKADWDPATGILISLDCAAGQNCTSVPEPGTLTLLGSGLLGLGLAALRRRLL